MADRHVILKNGVTLGLRDLPPHVENQLVALADDIVLQIDVEVPHLHRRRVHDHADVPRALEVVSVEIDDLHPPGPEIDMVANSHRIGGFPAIEAQFETLAQHKVRLTNEATALRASLDALKMLSIPIVECHLSNPAARETFRRKTYVSLAATGVISGFGASSYELAVEAAAGLAR